jgi:hypothetical protein
MDCGSVGDLNPLLGCSRLSVWAATGPEHYTLASVGGGCPLWEDVMGEYDPTNRGMRLELLAASASVGDEDEDDFEPPDCTAGSSEVF